MTLKKSIILLLIAAVVISGCLNYKPYDQDPAGDPEDKDFLDEIKEIEKELGLSEDSQEVTMPFDKGKDEPGEDTSHLQRLEVNENDLVSLKIKIDDPDQDKVTYTFSMPLNEEGKWKTSYGDAGEYVVTITASDGEHVTKKDVLLVVNRVNVAPVLKEIKDQTVSEGDIVKLEPQAIDPNGDPVTITISKPLEDGVWNTDHTSAGEYEIIVTASDGELDTKVSFILTVLDVNVKPVISGLSDITVYEGEKVVIDPNVTDLDGDEITVTISEPVGDDGVWQTGYTDNGVYEITVTASDGKDTVSETITLTVIDVNMPPEIIEVKLG